MENSRSALVNDFNEYIRCLNANIVARVVSETIFVGFNAVSLVRGVIKQYRECLNTKQFITVKD